MKDKEVRELLKERKKSKDICKELGINDRSWREIVKEYNDQYESRERLIVSNCHGYELTTNKKLIKAYAIGKLHHGLSELKTAKMILKTLSDKNQLSLLDDEQELVDVVMRFGE